MHRGQNLLDRIRTLQRGEKANKKCADCTEAPQKWLSTWLPPDWPHLCLPHLRDLRVSASLVRPDAIEVCTTCGGLHREFSHKVKGISVSKWTLEEVEDLERGGNAKANQKYLARWDQRDHPEPDSSDQQKVPSGRSACSHGERLRYSMNIVPFEM